MNNNIKASVGMLVPLSSLALFIYFSLLGNFLAAVLASIAGVMLWYLYSLVVESQMPDITGNVVILFGSLLAIAFFLNYGISKNMFGGFNIDLEGTAGSAVVFFFSVLLGISLRKQPAVSMKTENSEELTSVPHVSSEPPVLETSSTEATGTPETMSDNYSYYDPSEYEYPDYYDYEYDEDFNFYEDEE
tara:strand:- start:63 stop:629 length:567 start_codon:yes stop_codon:yes gene_type:complete